MLCCAVLCCAPLPVLPGADATCPGWMPPTFCVLHCLCCLSALRLLPSLTSLPSSPPAQNFLLTDASDGADLKLGDFGFAALLRPGRHMSEVLGSLGYIAPEVREDLLSQEESSQP